MRKQHETGNVIERRSPGRPREFDIDEVLDKSTVVFREFGFHAASIAKLGSATGLTEGSLYKAFKDKNGLFSAAFERYCSLRQKGLEEKLQSQSTGREQVDEALRYFADSSCGREGQIGCLIVGSASILGQLDDDVARQVRHAMGRNEKVLADLIRRGQVDGSITERIDALAVSQLLWHLLLGMRVAGKAGRSRRDVHAMVDQAMQLLL